MQLHELLTETARRFRDGEYLWAQHSMAYHVPAEASPSDAMIAGLCVPVRSHLANCFCGVGGILRTHSEGEDARDLEVTFPNLGAILARAAGQEPKPYPLLGWVGEKERYDLMPFINWNDGYVDESVSKDDVIAALERAAALATPPDPED